MIIMATKKTAMFTLTERLTIDANGTDTFATIDLGSYVDVGDRQAIQVHSVDYIFQGTTASLHPDSSVAADHSVLMQVTDLNRGGLVFANDRALISSASLYKATDGNLNIEADLFPDNFGKGADDGRYVVNDQLYITGLATQLNSGTAVNVTVRVNASIVTLGAKDFMAIAIQSTAADN
jgi:dUTPase